MRINFVSRGNNSIPSFRFHVDRPASYLASKGNSVVITNSPVESDIAIFQKHWDRSDIGYLMWAKRRGIKTAFHICDNHFDTIQFKDHYINMTQNADLILVSCEEMGKIVKEKTGRDSMVVQDSYEMDDMPAEFNPNGKLNLVWFGGAVNWKDIEEHKSAFEGYSVTIVSDKDNTNGKWKYIEHTVENKIHEIRAADVVVIPAVENERNRGRSANRVVDSIRLGKFVVASPLPDYKRFSNTMWIGDIREGLECIQSQKREVVESKINEAKKYVEKTHSMEVIGKQWEDAFSTLEIKESKFHNASRHILVI